HGALRTPTACLSQPPSSVNPLWRFLSKKNRRIHTRTMWPSSECHRKPSAFSYGGIGVGWWVGPSGPGVFLEGPTQSEGASGRASGDCLKRARVSCSFPSRAVRNGLTLANNPDSRLPQQKKSVRANTILDRRRL